MGGDESMTYQQQVDADAASGADEEERERREISDDQAKAFADTAEAAAEHRERSLADKPAEPDEIDIRDGDPNDPTWEVEVILRKKVKVRAKTEREAKERAVERCADKMWEGESPDDEETEILDGPEEDDDGEG